MPPFEELLAELLEEDPTVLGLLADVVNRGRMQADDIDRETLDVLTKFDLVTFLVQRPAGRPVRMWTYPTPLGLRVYAFLEREAEREEARQRALHPKPRNRRGKRVS